MTASLGAWEEFRLHVRAGLEQNGFTEDELKEVLLQVAAYAGVPRANTAFAEAAKVIEETLDDVKAKTDVSFTHG
jgi:3-oxoadipate enol-lactonase/4-carboxymuconolactone decarboxylase